jgi:hypothetical protein
MQGLGPRIILAVRVYVLEENAQPYGRPFLHGVGNAEFVHLHLHTGKSGRLQTLGGENESFTPCISLGQFHPAGSLGFLLPLAGFIVDHTPPPF